MTKIIKDTKQVTKYSEDHRQGGWSTHEEVAYFCGKCNCEIDSSVKFCSHCGTELKGIRDKIEERRKKQIKPYETAHDNLAKIRNTFDRESLEYKYLTEILKEINKEINCM